MSKTKTFGDFLLTEINRRGMSALQFAQFVGVSHTTINKFLDYGKKDVGYPSMDFVLKLSKATGVDIGAIVALIDPDVPRADPTDPETRVWLDQLKELSEEQRKMVGAMISGLRITNNG